MDLSVLEGDDPAGYKAEALIQKRTGTQTEEEWERTAKAQGRQQNPGSVSAADSGQFHAYRKNRRHELDRLEAFDREREKEEEQEEFQIKLKERLSEEEAKTAKRRAKRQKKQQQKEKVKTQPPQQQPGESQTNTESLESQPVLDTKSNWKVDC